MLAAYAFAALLASSGQAPTSLSRVMKAGEKLGYQVRSRLVIETRSGDLDTFIPEEVDFNYNFNTEAVKAKPDGIMDLRYRRPSITQIDGETEDAPPKTSVEKVNWDYLITLSPINELLEVKDQTKKAGGGKSGLRLMTNLHRSGLIQNPIGDFVSEMYRLSLFIGGLDSALDFQPKLPFDEVSPGDTWKRTVSYSPQKLKSKDNKMVMQRLDYVYTYRGVVDSEGKKVHRVTATLAMKTDLAQYVRDNVDNAGEVLDSIKEISFNLDAKIDYDLDLNTRRTLQAVAESKGGFKIMIVEQPSRPVVEQRLTGRTRLSLVGAK